MLWQSAQLVIALKNELASIYYAIYNTKTLDKLHDIIVLSCNQYLLDKRYRKEKINIANTPVCNLMNKIIFFSNTGYKGSKLENIINLSTDGPYLQRITYTDLITNRLLNLEDPQFYLKSKYISFVKGYNYDHIKISDSSIDLLNLGLTTKMTLKIDGSKNIENNTKNNLLKIRQITENKIVLDTNNYIPEKMGSEIALRGYLPKQSNKNLLITS